MDCAFCHEFMGNGEGRIISQDNGWLLLPTLGCFVSGYCLLMPVEHVDAAADIEPATLQMTEQVVERARTRIADLFGPVIVAEHGSRDCDLGAACCTHCHLHLIPVPDGESVRSAYENTAGPGQRLDALADLPDAVTGAYLYLSPRPGEHWVWPAGEQFARQYVRQVTAALHGIPDRYDWRDHPFTANLQHTLRIMLQPGSNAS